MHRQHLTGCGFGIVLALGIVWLAGGSAGSLGVILAVLLCPLIMLGALVLLTRTGAPADDPVQQQPPAHETRLR